MQGQIIAEVQIALKQLMAPKDGHSAQYYSKETDMFLSLMESPFLMNFHVMIK
jgi:hypothetical protein